MEEIRDGMKIGKHEMVGVIFEVVGIYYSTYGFGNIPRHGGNRVKAFKGGNEVESEVEKMVEDLNNGSIAFQRKREELKEENKSSLRNTRKPMTSDRERRQIKKMASDKRVFDFFS